MPLYDDFGNLKICVWQAHPFYDRVHSKRLSRIGSSLLSIWSSYEPRLMKAMEDSFLYKLDRPTATTQSWTNSLIFFGILWYSSSRAISHKICFTNKCLRNEDKSLGLHSVKASQVDYDARLPRIDRNIYLDRKRPCKLEKNLFRMFFIIALFERPFNKRRSLCLLIQ